LSVSSVSTASLSPLTTLEDAGRQAGLEEQLGYPHRHDGSPLRRLEDEGVAQGDRGAHFHSGITRREIERLMPATTPSGWRSE